MTRGIKEDLDGLWRTEQMTWKYWCFMLAPPFWGSLLHQLVLRLELDPRKPQKTWASGMWRILAIFWWWWGGLLSNIHDMEVSGLELIGEVMLSRIPRLLQVWLWTTSKDDWAKGQKLKRKNLTGTQERRFQVLWIPLQKYLLWSSSHFTVEEGFLEVTWVYAGLG